MKGRLLCAALAALATAQSNNPFKLSIATSGSYNISLPGVWGDFQLQSADVGIQVNGKWQGVSNGGLVADGGMVAISGTDGFGDWTGFALAWKLTSTGNDVMYTTWRQYTDVPALAFEQYIPQDVQSGGTYAAKENVSTSFPSFQLPSTPTQIGAMHFEGTFIDNSVNGPTFVNWGPGMKWTNGLQGGPAVFFSPDGNNSVVFSSLSNFMAGSTAQEEGTGNILAGLLGSLVTIPGGTKYETVLWYGTGINAGVMSWGAAMLQRYGKSHEGPRFDFTNTHLGYNTDHGAFYYYTTGNYSDYLQTLLAVNDYATAQGIPYKHVLLDSWWYFKGVGNGVKNWTAMPSVFPGGNAGIRNLTASTGWKVIAHNRYWSANTDYAIANGGQWNFYVDKAGSPAGGQMAVPLDQGFWEYLLGSSVREWGLTTYEQDWLYNLLEGVDILTSDVTMARQWMLQMNAGAEAAGVTMQLCMPYPRHMLQSVEMPAVTQIRASDDHVPGDMHYPSQWKLGYSSLFSWSLAVAPFKDNYESTQVQPGGYNGNKVEVSPALQEAISVFSAGPVTPGDGVGYSDAALIMRACTASGRLLQPSRAATIIDKQALNRLFPQVNGPVGEVYGTWTWVSGWIWDHFLAADLSAPYALTTSDLAPIRADVPIRHPTASSGAPLLARSHDEVMRVTTKASDQGMVAYSLNSTTFDMGTLTVQPFDAAHPIALAACNQTDFQVWHVAPVFSNGWAYLGELTKFVPVAEARTASVAVIANSDTMVEVVGQQGEVVPLSFWNAGNVTTVTCTIGASGRATAVMPYGICN